MTALSSYSNFFLASLSAEDRQLVEPQLKPMELAAGHVFYTAREPSKNVYFPYSGLVSLNVGFATGQFTEAGMVGRNSVIGAGAALDGTAAAVQAIGQVGGCGSVIRTAALRNLIATSKSLGRMIARHEHMATAQAQQVAACNAVHGLEQRLSRCLLQARDLLESDDLRLTQEILSQMLGVQRTSVTVVAQRLQDARIIDYQRGVIHVLNVDALQNTACECYEAINDHYLRLTGWIAPVNKGRGNNPSGGLDHTELVASK